MKCIGFGPIANRNCRVLILGSLPGRRSLEQGQYYALPRNAFWRILGDLFRFQPDADYEIRKRCLLQAGIALWDVCESAQRTGSLDASIQSDTIVVNDFAGFLSVHRELRLICFNGGRAADLYRRKVQPRLPPDLRSIPSVALPSTSPAHAGMSYGRKLERWSVVQAAAGIRASHSCARL
jgi:double-stranded uracil-DNA glycosylase